MFYYKLRNRSNSILLLLSAATFATLIVINFFSTRVLSSIRSYINGESEYSKGQKESLLYLSAYMHTADTTYWHAFNTSIAVPLGDNIARQALETNGRYSTVRNGFLSGGNDAKDIPDMVWLYRKFHSVSFMHEAISIWGATVPLINQLNFIGHNIRDKISLKTLSADETAAYTLQVSSISAELSKKESAFSHVLTAAAHYLTIVLFITDTVCILFILGSIITYVVITIRRLKQSEQTLLTQNVELNNINKELDTFVYSISHDLRSPITSIKGLIGLIKEEDDIATLKEYAILMEKTIDKQDDFIKEIIDFFKNKRSSLSYKKIALKDFIEDIINTNQFNPLAKDMLIDYEISTEVLYTDELRLKMILNNLVSNAIRYSDETKQVRTIKIKVYETNNYTHLEVADNGIGIQEKYLENIFEMFFVTPNNNKGSGLGLYILKQNVEKLNGKVQLVSEVKEGSLFTISLPNIINS